MYFTCLLLGVMVSCKGPVVNDATDMNDTVEIIDTSSSEVEVKDLSIFIPFNYEKDVYGAELKQMDSDWLVLYPEDGDWRLANADFRLTEDVNECNGYETLGLHPRSGLEPLLYISPLPNIVLGNVSSLSVKKEPLWPDVKQVYQYKGSVYAFRATGTVKESYEVVDGDDTKEFKEVANYKLYLSIDGNSEQLILNVSDFDDSFVELLFVGDIDGDGVLDFVFDSSVDYENKRVVLYLSKGMQGSPYATAEVNIDFSC